jgi:ATP-binding cassette subfamily F protein uup
MTLLSCEDISKSYGSRTLFEGLSFGLFRGDKIGIIGPNGAGKSSLLKILAGLENADEGNVSYRKSLKIGYVPQMSSLPAKSVHDILVECLHDDHTLEDYEREIKAQIILGKFGFPDPQQLATELSGGWKKRLELAKQIIREPDILLLDEPTNHLDLEGILWLETFLPKEVTTYIVISHDRYLLEHVTNKVIELNRTYPKGLYSVDGPYSTFLEKRELFLEGQLQIQKSLASKVRREIDWLRQTPKARTTKSRSRIQEANELIKDLADVKSRNKKNLANIDFTASERQTRKLVTVKNISKRMGDRELFSRVEFTLSPGSRLGIVGRNGTGKTTLLKMIAGEIKPDIGTIKYADQLQIVYFDQQREQLPPTLTLAEALSPTGEFVNYHGNSIHVNSWCKRFLFRPEQMVMPIGQLSGGERARVLIARLMLKPADILLLDEPTNDLDIPTLEILEESLEEFEGAIVLITHDRFMMDQVTTSIIGLGGEGQAQIFADYGQWEAYEEQQEKVDKEPEIKKEVQQQSKPTPQKKLTYKEKLEYEKMESTILELEQQIDQHKKTIDDPESLKDLQIYQKLCEELHSYQEHLDRCFQRWQELEDKMK